MTPRVQKFLEKTKTYSESKWGAIKSYEEVSVMTLAELQHMLPLVTAMEIEKTSTRLARYEELEAPTVIVENVRKLLEKAKRGRGPRASAINRAINKFKPATA